jgi:2-oxoglutarate dehydrogenase E2 component (dihydrolipoamide succinyltransferase)
MKENVIIPAVGESIVEGVLVEWFRDTGDHVRIDEDLYEFETEKASVRVPCPYEGILEIIVPAGETVSVGQTVATIDTEVGDTAAVKDSSTEASSLPPVKTPASPAKLPKGDTPASGEIRLSPSVRRMVEENDLDITGINGTGKGGRITKADLSAAASGGEKKKDERAGMAPVMNDMKGAAGIGETQRGVTRKPMSPIRKSIAAHLLSARREAAHLTTFNEINMERLMVLRDQHQERFVKRHGVKLGIMSFFIKAVIAALAEFPIINSRIEGDDVVTCHFYDIGVAVSTDRGLLVPVLRNANTLGFAEIEEKIADYAERARNKKIQLPELQGGTFSITNGGIFGSMMSTPIPNHPQPAILGLHAIKDRPIAVAGKVEVKPMMYTALTYDHRLIDGREAVTFLFRIKELIEDPEKLFLES